MMSNPAQAIGCVKLCAVADLPSLIGADNKKVIKNKYLINLSRPSTHGGNEHAPIA
jgi:hypothetical protein